MSFLLQDRCVFTHLFNIRCDPIYSKRSVNLWFKMFNSLLNDMPTQLSCGYVTKYVL